MKYIKLFQDDSERIPFEANEYEEPYVSLTLDHKDYSASIGGRVAEATPNGDGTFTVKQGNYLTATVSSQNTFIYYLDNPPYSELSSASATDGQNVTFEISGTTYYGQWFASEEISGWELYTASDYSGNVIGYVFRVIITSEDLGQLLRYDKPLILTLTLNDESTVEFNEWFDGEISINASMIDSYRETVVSAVIENGVKSIGASSFGSCSGLTSIAIPSSVTSIGSSAFKQCSGLTNITIPSSVTSIGEDFTFHLCVNLTDITFEDPTKIESLGYNGDYMFGDCYNLESINITADTPWTFMPYRGFIRCYKLKSIVIPNSVTNIMGMALCNCSSLTEITIPSGVTNIGMQAFDGCSGLTSITCLATTPPTLNSTALNNTNNCIIYVPSESVAAYKAASNWSRVSGRIQAIPSE